MTAELKPRFEHWFLRRLDKIYPKASLFYCTIGNTIYCPAGTINIPRHVLDHEHVHIEQQRRHGLWLFLLLYVCVPYCRWRYEREAYLVNLRQGVYTINEVVEILWWGYFMPWPRWMMRRWFQKNL